VKFLLSPYTILIVGIIGFSALGYANQKLANGLRFSQQPNSQKRIIVAVSIAQLPYLWMVMLGAFRALGVI
jgi:hypothetical protein